MIYDEDPRIPIWFLIYRVLVFKVDINVISNIQGTSEKRHNSFQNDVQLFYIASSAT